MDRTRLPTLLILTLASLLLGTITMVVACNSSPPQNVGSDTTPSRGTRTSATNPEPTVATITPLTTNSHPSTTEVAPAFTSTAPAAGNTTPTASNTGPTSVATPNGASVATNREPTRTAIAAPIPTRPATGATYYVSRSGNNADGRSWATAWNELDQIKWNVIQPGDTIRIDGGESRMTYTTTLTAKKSGTAEAPITIALSDEVGRNGKAIIFGGRSTLLPWYGQPGYVYEATARKVGLDLRNQSWIVVDGSKWSGIDLHGFDNSAIWLSSSSQNDTIRYAEIYDNGFVKTQQGLSHAERPGVALSGKDITFERVIVHDNGEDSFQSGGGIANFTLRDSWLYQSRHDPSGGIWNYKQHPDGVQVFAGGDMYGVTVEGCVIGPGFMHGLLLGQSPYGNPPAYATVHNVTVTNTLFYGNGNANILSQSPPTAMTNWRIENVTSDRPVGEQWHNVGFIQPSGGTGGLSIVNSIFTGGDFFTIPQGGEYVGNVYWQVKPNPGVVGSNADPEYADSSVYGSVSLSADYSLKQASPFASKGSSVHSAAQLVGTANALASAHLLPSTATP